MQLDHYVLILLSAVVVHSTIVAVVAYRLNHSKSIRKKPLWKFVAADGVIFIVGLLFFSSVGSSQSILNLLTGISYITIGAFVVAIEIPGYLFLSKHDEEAGEYLTELRNDLVKVGYSFEHINALKADASRNLQILNEVQLNGLLIDFVSSCEHMNNVDRRFWELVLTELTGSIKEVSKRSKHPAPKLVDILSLAGLSFLLAHFLRLLS